MTFSHSSRARLTPRSAQLFPGETLFARLARAVCEADCLPRKELFESWEVARRARRIFRGGRVLDLAAGHGLLAFTLSLLDDTSPEALCVDRRQPESFARLARTLEAHWPRLEGRIHFLESDLGAVEARPTDLVASVHACGALTDRVLEKAVAARARVAVLPCCHDLAQLDQGGLEGWLDGPVAVDAARALRLGAQGYRVRTQRIPQEITPQNRLLLGEPL